MSKDGGRAGVNDGERKNQSTWGGGLGAPGTAAGWEEGEETKVRS